MLEAIRDFALGSPDTAAKARAPGTDETIPNLGIVGQPKRRLSSGNSSVYLQSYGGDEAIDFVNDCVELIAQTTSNADYHFQRPEDSQDTRLSHAPDDLPDAPE